ncbi:hypothetical protein [Maridesulfovibrio salexigens]|uniref:hypothetical protein n=1 Tax=Maridesulfovibrio salexigens TaxID=880 RepID=UPI00031B501A|nr:hypothetical protein [Maridesulfovibrio salexigens]
MSDSFGQLKNVFKQMEMLLLQTIIILEFIRLEDVEHQKDRAVILLHERRYI